MNNKIFSVSKDSLPSADCVECTDVEIDAKMAELISKLQLMVEIAPSKIDKWQMKLAELKEKASQAEANGDDPRKACEYVDEMMNELEADLHDK